MLKINRIIAIVFACCVLFFATLAAVYLLSRTGAISNLFPTSEPLASFQQFHVISHDLDENDDLNTECELQLGGGVRLADWNDIVAFYEGGGSLDEFIAAVKMSIRDDMRPYFEQIIQTNKEKVTSKSDITSTSETYDDEYRISFNGNLRYANTDRHYFVGRHDHIKPPGFLAHDDLNRNQLSLGSWRGRGGYAICYGEFNENTIGIPLASFQKFHLIAHDLDENGDLNEFCKTELGKDFRIADWNDILAFYSEGGSLDDFIAGLKMAERDERVEMFFPTDFTLQMTTVNITEMPKEVPDAIADEYRISKEGEPRYQTGRHYFVGRHEHIKPPGFLSHDHINNYQLTLGSWRGKGGHALAYGNLMGMSTSTILLIFYGIVLGVTLTIVYILNPRWLFREKTKQ